MANELFPLQLGPMGQNTVVDASGFLAVTSGGTGPYRIFGHGEYGFPLLVDASGRIVISPLSAGGIGGSASTVELTAATGVTVDLTSNRNFHLLLDDDVEVTLENPVSGAKYTFTFEQDGIGNHAVTWVGDILWRGGSAPTITAASGSIDVVSMIYNSVLGMLLADVSADFS